MTDEKLCELMELRAAATPGPWKHDIASSRDGMGFIWPLSSIKNEAGEEVTEDISSDNAAYIVAACNAVPELVQQIRELSYTVTRLGLMLADAYKYIDTVRLPESGTPVMAPPDLRDMIEKFRRENFTEDTAGAGGKDHYSNPERLTDFLTDTLVPDYRDAAEFEARVAKKMATVICGECEGFNKKPNCPISIYQAHGLYECRMKHARLSVEAEMIREGKGPGSPEVK